MTIYFIKAILCSALFFILYKLLFENEKMHRFNRGYLLLSIVFSMVVPFITIPHNLPILPTAETNILNPENFYTYNNTQTSVAVKGNNSLPFILLSIYVTVTTLLLFRFGVNLTTLFSTISNSPVMHYKNAKLVLINDHVTSHSFLNYIFINREYYENGKVEDEVLLHELTHVHQKHSIDILFVELVQTIFWFNPVFIFYRKAIQLNHEFLADSSVVNTYHNTFNYQQLLIAKASHKNSLLLTSQFNYLITKKRLIMMTRSTSTRKALCKQIALVPLLVASLFMFSINTIAQDTASIVKPKAKEVQSTQEGVSQEMMNEYAQIVTKNKLTQKINTPQPVISDAYRNRLETIFFAMSKEQQAKQTVTFLRPGPLTKNKPTIEQFRAFKNSKNYAITLDDKKVDNSELNKYKPSDFAHCYIVYLAKTNSNHGKHLPIDVYLMTNEYYKAYAENFPAKHPDYIMINKITKTFKKVGQK